ncbi:hypothetical protein M426DRAFT_13502 [Hypoxylon sp. CI-4A]|nr:hypothetical protein M426DRAFT_13502 [Hypoxylon sp. CI-4A]
MSTTSSLTGIPAGLIAPTASSLGPLTTPFIVPSSCGPDNTYSLYNDPTNHIVVWQVGPTNTASRSSCLPESWIVNGYYSPAICPYGYTRGCAATQNNVETTICCPTNLDFSCHSTMAYESFGCYYSAPTIDVTNLVIDVQTSTGTYPNVDISDQPVFAFSVQVQKPVSWAPATSSASTTTSSSDTSTPAVGGATTPAQTGAESTFPQSTPLPSTKAALSGGAIAGIVVGVLGALAIGALITFLLMRRRKTPSVYPSPQMTAAIPPAPQQPPHRVLHEMDPQRGHTEMPTWDQYKGWEMPA